LILGGIVIRVVGIDIHPMQASKLVFNKYFAAVVVEDEKLIVKINKLSLKNLVHIINKYDPDYIATDNIFEIGPPNTLSLFLIKIPSKTKIVQVTGAPNVGYISLPQLIKQVFNKRVGHLSPLESAYYNALLVFKQVGYVLKYFNPYTIILVSRSRHPGKGGQSQARFQRRLQIEVKDATQHIKNILKEHNIEFDTFVIKTAYGYKKSKIVAYAQYDTVLKLINSTEFEARIKILPSIGAFEFMPLGHVPSVSKNINIIVGIDPGITVGLACIDMRGNVVLLKSKTEWTLTEILREITNQGMPVLICSDITPAPSFVQKVSAILHTKLFLPSKPISVSEKRELVDYNSNLSTRNAHERDALAAALKAYLYFKPKLEKLRKRLTDEGLLRYSNMAYIDLFNNKPISSIIASLKTISSSKDVLKTKSQPRLEVVQETNESAALLALKNKLDESRRTIELLEKENKKLKDRIHELESTIYRLERKIDRLHSEHMKEILFSSEIKKRDELISLLKNKIMMLENKIKYLEREINIKEVLAKYEKDSNFLIAKTSDNLSIQSLEAVDKKYGILEGDILYLKNGGGGGRQSISFIISKRVKAIISETDIADNLRHDIELSRIPIIRSNELGEIHIFGPYAILDRKTFNLVFKKKEIEITNKIQAETEIKIKRMLEEYRRRRWSTI